MTEELQFQGKLEKSKLMIIISIIFVLVSFLLFTLPVLLAGVIYPWGGLDIFALSVIPFSLASIFAVLAMIYGILQYRSIQEDEEKYLLKERREKVQSAFDVSEDVRFSAGRYFANFKKYGATVISILAALFMGTVLFFFFRNWSVRVIMPYPANSMALSFVCAILMIFSFLSGTFLVGQSYDKEYRWLRPVGAWLLAGSATSLVALVCALMIHFKKGGYEKTTAYIIAVIFVILALEMLLTVIMEFYRPRTAEIEKPVFESRLLGLFTEPGGVMRNIADTLDYQFGFKVSRTWIYSFIEKSLVPLVIFWLFALWMFTCIEEVSPNEVGVRERFGKLLDGKQLPAGIYFKLPWPCERIARYNINQIHEVVIGPEMKKKDGKEVHPPVVLWTKSHYAKESRFLVGASKYTKDDLPLAFLSASVPIQYRIKKDGLIDFAYNNTDAPKILKNIGERVAVSYFASVDLLRIMCQDREKTIIDLKKLVQQEADKAGLGIEIVYVNFHDAHPPVGGGGAPGAPPEGGPGGPASVSKAFQDVISAMEQKETDVIKAKTEEISKISNAEAKAVTIVLEAKAYKKRVTTTASAGSDRFLKQLGTYKEMPSLFKLNTYLDFLEKDCRDIRKYIMSSDIPYQIYELNLEEKSQVDVLTAGLSDFVDDAKKKK